MRLINDLYSINKELLARREADINPPLLQKIRRSGKKHAQARIPIKKTAIYKDFQKVFNDKRYITMLKPPVSIEKICHIVGSLRLENDLVLELGVMKKSMPYTYAHLLVVAAFSIKLSLVCNPDDYNSEIVAHRGLTHDLGKTRLPPDILNKKGKLTNSERRIIETHPAIAYLLLSYYLKSGRRDCCLASLDHHERLDGSGYPKGIKRLNRYAQLISAIDVMDALMSRRPYRKKIFSLRPTLDYLIKQANMHKLNRDIVLHLISLARKDKPDPRLIEISKYPREDIPEEITHDKYI